MRRSIAFSVALLTCALPAPAAAADAVWSPGLYRVEVKIGLPNVPAVAPPMQTTRCLTRTDLENGSAFGVLSDNSIKTCPVFDYELTGSTATYQIVCPGPNAASAVAEFQATRTGYRGVIKMQMGAKNMTMSETQIATRAGECR